MTFTVIVQMIYNFYKLQIILLVKLQLLDIFISKILCEINVKKSRQILTNKNYLLCAWSWKTDK